MYGCSLPPATTLGWGGLRASLGTLRYTRNSIYTPSSSDELHLCSKCVQVCVCIQLCYTSLPERSTVTLGAMCSGRTMSPHRHFTKVIHWISHGSSIHGAPWWWDLTIEWITRWVGWVHSTFVELTWWTTSWTTFGHPEWCSHRINWGWECIINCCWSYNKYHINNELRTYSYL